MDEPGINGIAGLLFNLSLPTATLLRDADLEEAAFSEFVYLSRLSALNEDGIEP